MKKQSAIQFAIILLLLPVATAFARPEHGQKHKKGVFSEEQREKIAARIFKRLDLSSEQDTKMRTFFEEHTNLKDEMHGIMEQRKKLHSLLSSSVTSDEEVREQANKTAQQFVAVQNKRLEMMLKVKKILRPEQFERLLTIMHKLRQKAMQGGEKVYSGKFE